LLALGGCASAPAPAPAVTAPEAAVAGTASAPAEVRFFTPAQSLFNGVSLDGWRKTGGGATFGVEDGCIVGEVGPGPNTFLCTTGDFSDFVLTVELRLDVPGNSGIQFRSHADEHGRVYGYQCEVDPSERAWSGGIYDEGRRGWLHPLEGPGFAEARAAFRIDGWNTYRIEAIGPRLRTWVNGIPCADLVDDVDAEGFIALQVHSGAQGRIRWRNIVLTPSGPAARAASR
jgi:hypothetical protein